MRVGIGYDIHRLKTGLKLTLGGTLIPYRKGLLGHSDGDVLSHATVDAALGAAGLGDIGDYFSDKDASHKGRNSAYFIDETRKLLHAKGWAVSQLDTVIIAQKPRLGEYKKLIRSSLAKSWGLELSLVGVKAKTNEGLDSVGKVQAIACYAVATLTKVKGSKRKSKQ